MLRRVEVINHPRGARADLHLGAHHRPLRCGYAERGHGLGSLDVDL